MLNIKLSNIVQFLNLSYIGDDVFIKGFNLANRQIETNNILTYASSSKYLKMAIKNPKVVAIITELSLYEGLTEEVKGGKTFIISDNPEYIFYSLFIEIVNRNYFEKPSFETNLSNVDIGKGTIIEKGVILGKNVKIGDNSVVKAGTIIGDNVVIGACSVIGGNGFQLIKDKKGNNMNIPHVGRVIINDNVTIGDCTTISNSLFEGATSIGKYTKIDNHVHIAHNCVVGENCVLTANCTMFGSSELRNNVWIAPNAAIMNRVVVGDNAFICASSFVIKNVEPGAKMFGIPAQKIN